MSRKAAWAVGILILVLAAVGIGWSIWGNERPTTVLVVLPTIDNPFWRDVRRGVDQAAAGFGDGVEVSVRTGIADTDAEAQINHLRTFLNDGGVRALVLGPADSRALVNQVSAYNERGIPVVVVDTKLDSAALDQSGGKMDAFVGSLNTQGGELAARRMIELIGDGPRHILIVGGSPVHPSATDRANGFRAGSPASWDIEEKVANWSRAEAMEVTRAELQQGLPDAIFAASDEMAMGVIEGLEREEISFGQWPALIGFDATEDGLRAIQEGKMCATVAQQPVEMGAEGFRLAVALARDTVLMTREHWVDVQLEPRTAGACPAFMGAEAGDG